ncbi:hypothetical protein ABFS82_10G171500 [Erythranthe guttata]|nr:PREDICTED: uncharacterized protein LOC105955165 [Erythranthe guttata]|eukprot:XP_012834320.1 PREDICTED: uncharacterized protein LOC105955165 [Erythranthe guttata]
MMKSLVNPNFPTMAALFHSTPFLTFKKRVSWPDKVNQNHRWARRPTFKPVCKISEISPGLIVGKLNDDKQTAWHWRAEDRKSQSQDHSKKYENKSSFKERSQDYSKNNENASSNIKTCDRSALGLSANGPLNLEDVKTAYRSCALKWHPDHHRGFSKAFAEEKFKICNAAYQSLCDKLSSS